MTGPGRGVRPSSGEIDRGILDITAGFIARRGIKDTAVQAVADQAGYSKAGILSRFGSKELLVRAAVAQAVEQTEAILALADGATPGPAKDAAALAGLTDLALARPGWAELVLAALALRRGDDVSDRLGPVAAALLGMFGIDIESAASTSLERRAAVTGAVGALIVLSLTYMTEASAEQARPHLLQTGWNALGHGGPFPGA
ncbi:TetR/AcrR family transcriptional regulator [Frondihabitans cladoniiphilus]|uniref:HTH tetR-type domain-containing protein n=1 Tax=Frondihabitans cladoniiphilus TaxID=715785 RepID=A0ABP8WB80_9MICO